MAKGDKDEEDETPIACWRAVPIPTIINMCGIVFVCLWSYLERKPVIDAAEAFGFNIAQWTNIVLGAIGGIVLIDGLIVLYAMAVSNYCLNHHCCQCLIQKPEEFSGDDCCHNCCASFLGQWVQRFLFLAAWALGLVFTVFISGMAIAHVFLIQVDGACLAEGDELAHKFKDIMVLSIPKMGTRFYSEDSLAKFFEDTEKNCEIVNKGTGPAEMLWYLSMIMCILQWNLVLTAYANFVRVDSTEKTKHHIARKLSRSMTAERLESSRKKSLEMGAQHSNTSRTALSDQSSIVINLPGGRERTSRANRV